MSSIARDVRYFVRTLGRQPGFALTVVLSLAIGIGANTVMFGVAKRILLERVAARDPESLVLLEWSAKEFPTQSLSGSVSFIDGARSTSFSHPAYVSFLQNAKTLTDIVAFSDTDRLNVSIQGTPTMASGVLVSGNYYTGLGVGAAAGRTLTTRDDTPGAAPVAKARTVSDVEVSPSMVMALKLPPTASTSASCRSVGAIGASVNRKASMVAMSGAIMPAPLAMPLMLTVTPSISAMRVASLG